MIFHYDRKYKRKYNRTQKSLLLFCLLLFFLSGCKGEYSQIVFYSDFGKNEVFRIENMKCILPEMMIYLTATQNRYESVYGTQIWEANLDGITMEENMKEMVLAQISQMKAMNLLAGEEKVELTKEEKEKAERAAEEFFSSLEEAEVKLLSAQKSQIETMYQEYALANKVYDHVVKDVNPEVSDDEARTITVEHILVKTYSLNEQGEKVPLSQVKKREAYDRIREAEERIKEGESFETVAEEYNEDVQNTYSFRKGEMNLDFETTAFNLGKDEVSHVIETEYGYHLIKCISTFDQEQTDANKIIIVEKKKEEVFDERYTNFVSDLTKILNEKLWERVTLFHEEEVDCSEFFTIYEKYLGEDQVKQFTEF